jgi:alpha-L-rhamnosidase
MNSYNHYSYGAVCQWLFESVAGISPDPEHPGFKRVKISPVPLERLNPVSAWHEIVKGRIEAWWTMADGKVEYSISLPEGCEGLFVPTARHVKPVVDGKPVSGDTLLAAGRHLITFDSPKSN